MFTGRVSNMASMAVPMPTLPNSPSTANAKSTAVLPDDKRNVGLFHRLIADARQRDKPQHGDNTEERASVSCPDTPD